MVEFKRVVIAILGVVFPISSPVLGHEQQVEEEQTAVIWPGKLRLPNERPESVSFQILQDGETFILLSMKYKGKSFEIKKFKIEQDTLFFTWKPGEVETNCELHKQEGKAYVGHCLFPESENSLDMTVLLPQPKPAQNEAP